MSLAEAMTADRMEAADARPGSTALSGLARVSARTDARVVMDSLRRIVRSLRAVGDGPVRRHGLTSARLFVLRQIAAHPGLGLGDLAARTLTRESSVSEVVTRLVDAELVERRGATGDRRRVELRLTPAGEHAIAEAGETPQERLIAGLRALPDEERHALAEGFAAWLALSGLQDAPVMFFEPLPDASPSP